MTTMKNYWKQFAVWATRLGDDPFWRSRLRFTLAYLLTMVAAFMGGYFVLRHIRTEIISQYLVTHLVHQNTEVATQEINMLLNPLTLRLFLTLSLCVSVLGYFIAPLVLMPLRNIVRAQKRFIADASHELRTPLSIIKADSEIAILDGAHIQASEAIATLQSNLEEVDRMSKIIENLLSLSFYDNKVTEVPFSRIDLAQIVSHFIQKAQTLALKKGVKLYMIKNETAIMLGNRIALEQMTMNLVRNAIFYTPQGGSVTISIQNKNPNTVELCIQDTGIGIAPADLPNIFNPFYRVSGHHNKSNSGLGLTIVKKIVDRHNGLIYAKSELGRGTLFTVILPTVPA